MIGEKRYYASTSLFMLVSCCVLYDTIRIHCFEAFCPFAKLYLCMFFQVFGACKEIMIKMACPDALARLKETELRDEAEEIWNIYFQKQEHLCLSKLLTESRNRKLANILHSQSFNATAYDWHKF